VLEERKDVSDGYMRRSGGCFYCRVWKKDFSTTVLSKIECKLLISRFLAQNAPNSPTFLPVHLEFMILSICRSIANAALEILHCGLL
jgi:hypothetical protein